MAALSTHQQQLSDKYIYSNYVTRLTPEHRNTKEEIFELERATRGQTQNPLWQVLRLNRTTASNSSSFCAENDAMRYGVENEKTVKKNQLLMRALEEQIAAKLNCTVTETVLDCGMFITPIGLFSASPDAYFLADDGRIVVLEIKCPYTYRNTDLESIRRGFNNKPRYRIPNTAFSVNRRGPLDVRVEKKNDHYRQVQAQMYVTDAALAIYLVKIGRLEEIHFVERDEEIIAELRAREEHEHQRCLRENAKQREFVMERNRLWTFSGVLGRDEAKRLARAGFYSWNGCVRCHFCHKTVELAETTVERVLAEHQCNAQHGNVRYANIKYRNYLPLQTRMDSLAPLALSPDDVKLLASNNIFLKNNTLKLYCCGVELLTNADKADDIKSIVTEYNHSVDCDRY
ncbi:ALK-EXO [Betabaculovirus altermyunipunctae]|uniref:ALK-EXO n=1 Tax=Betabaculovirus altermyunipunctae TaxID=3051996 RepID=A0A1S5YE75_9BBAC|nr:ALK-EXO [Betabaculovirus altermyunipunctae]AQQ80396.1 ALK-EXO [Betabaculovirus altermyunipunctae]